MEIRKQIVPAMVGVLIAISLFVFACLFIYAWIYVSTYLLPYDPPNKPSPLSETTVADLCQKLAVPRTTKPCIVNATVYEYDFYPVIADAIDRGELLTKQEWEERFGEYLEECHEVAANRDGIKPTRCDFNFNQDHRYFITVEFLFGSLDRIFYLKPEYSQ